MDFHQLAAVPTLAKNLRQVGPRQGHAAMRLSRLRRNEVYLRPWYPGESDNNAARARHARPGLIGRKTPGFVRPAPRAEDMLLATAYTLIETSRSSRTSDPTSLGSRTSCPGSADHKITAIDELLPWHCKA